MESHKKIFYRRYNADIHTPVAVYSKIKHKFKISTLFESVEKAAGRGRYSIIAFCPDLIWECYNSQSSVVKYYDEKHNFLSQEHSSDPLGQLKQINHDTKCDIDPVLPSAAAGLFGYFSYDAIRLVEEIPQPKIDTLNIPDGYLFRPRIVIIFDNVYDDLFVITNNFDGQNDPLIFERRFSMVEALLKQDLTTLKISISENTKNQNIKPDITHHQTPDSFIDAVNKAKEYIYAGDAFQIVPSQRFSVAFYHEPLEFYRTLRRLNPSPYMFFFDNADFNLAGASPEILVRNQNGTVTIRPIAGTRPRGKTPDEDKALEQELLSDEKEISEHLMLLDLGRNDVGRISKVGTVDVTDEYFIERYSHVMHIVSNVQGQLQDGLDFIDAFFSALPAGTVSGAPKIRAMEIINEIEQEKRSFYAGGIGYFSSNGNGDFSIMLRTALIKDNIIYVQAGAGVVADSNPQSEYEETLNKAKALFKAIEMTLNAF